MERWVVGQIGELLLELTFNLLSVVLKIVSFGRVSLNLQRSKTPRKIQIPKLILNTGNFKVNPQASY